MCNEVYIHYSGCGCKLYSNTYKCHIALGCKPGEETLSGMPELLPKSRPRDPVDRPACYRTSPLRPKSGKCPDCHRNRRSKPRDERLSSSGSNAAGPSGSGSSSRKNAQSLTPVAEEF